MGLSECQSDGLRDLGLHISTDVLSIIQLKPRIVGIAKIVIRSDVLAAVHKAKPEAATLSVFDPASLNHQREIDDHGVFDQRAGAGSS
jgi:hypothetical protein